MNSSKPEPTIFWGFIQSERNNVLKEYAVGAKVNVTVRPGTVHIDLNTRTQTVRNEPQPNLYEYVTGPGPFEGRDQRDVVSEAIDFWDGYLKKVEREYEKART